MINWKIVVIFPIFALVISILAGAIGGASFLDIFVRGIIWTIVFGGIGIGVSYLIERFFPELKDFSGDGISKTDVKTPGGESGFEAFIPEDNPHELEEMKNSYDTAGDDELGPQDDSNALPLDKDEDEIGVLTEAEEPVAEGKDSDESEYYNNQGLGFDGEEPDTIADSKSGRGNKKSTNNKESDDEGFNDSELVFDDDGIDKLPDSVSFDDSLQAGSHDSSFESGGSFSKPYKNTSVGEFEQDPLKTARAIHTMMQKDKEG
jgi:hypothetical protein